jgi:hypothetical protein
MSDAHCITTIAGVRIYRDTDGSVFWVSGMTVNADGSPHAYHQEPGKGLDYLENAGGPGHWWGIATDRAGIPFVQTKDDPAPGYYVSTTSMFRPQFLPSDPRRYVDSETTNYIVLPAQFSAVVGERFRFGHKCIVSRPDLGVETEAIYADVGPKTHIGEGSIALASALRINPDPKDGGTPHGVLFRLLPA